MNRECTRRIVVTSFESFDIVLIHALQGLFGALSSFTNKRCEWFITEGAPRRNELFDDSELLVLSHLDLNLHNPKVACGLLVWILSTLVWVYCNAVPVGRERGLWDG